jgi:imidazolonepropionase-like amidohydrolase
MRGFALCALVSVLISACVAAADSPAGDSSEDVIALVGARLIDGNGGAPLENAVVLIRGDRFESVGPEGSVDVPPDAELIDLSGKTIMPPMISLHNHVAMTDWLDNSALHFTERNVQDS